MTRRDEMDAETVIRTLGLEPHPEGGAFTETFRDPRTIEMPGRGPREWSTAIYYLLREGEVSHWHRVDAAEVWHHYAGAPLELEVSLDGREQWSHRLGDDLSAGERPQAVVPTGAWQRARSLGAWTLVGCTVAPGFRFERFELAPEGWEPGSGPPSAGGVTPPGGD